MLGKYIKWFWRFYRNHKIPLTIFLTFSLISSALIVTNPLLIKNVFDILENGQPSKIGLPYVSGWLEALTGNRIPSLVILMIMVGAMTFLSEIFLIGHRAYMNMKLEWEFRQSTFDDLTVKGPDFFNRFSTGDLVTRMTDDVSEDKLSWFACSGIFRFYQALTLILFSLVMMISIHPMLTLWTAGPLPFLVFIYMKSSTVLDRRYDFLQQKISLVNDAMEACFSGIRVVKAYSKEKDQRTKFGKIAEERRQAEVSVVKSYTIIESLWMYVWQIGIIMILLAGGYYVIKGSLTIGEFVAFESYVLFMIYPMFDVGNFMVKGLRAAVSIKRIIELEDHPPMIDEKSGSREFSNAGKPRVQFDHVSFRFAGMERDILHDLNFTVQPGQRVAIVGKVGSGKSWAVRLIPRLVDPTEGRVLLDGADLREYDIADIRRNIGYVPQEPILFSDTIEENIRFHRDGISKDTLDWAIEVSQLGTEIKAFPKGLQTEIGVRGLSISGGQKQRLSLARALVGQPRILILDDCTSALDANTEAALWERLYQVMPDLTTFIITHRPATLERADYVYVLDDGEIVEQGKHIDLILQEGLYCKLYHRIMLEEAVGLSDAESKLA